MTPGPLDTNRTLTLCAASSAASHSDASASERNARGTVQCTVELSPSLIGEQIGGLKRLGIEALRYYERAIPSLQDLRHCASELARDAVHLRPDDATGQLDAAKRRMVLEGKLLSKHPDLDFEDAGLLLDLHRSDVIAPRVPHADSLRKLEDQLGALLSESPETQLPHVILHSTLEQGLSDIAKYLEGHEAFYHQVRQSKLSDAEREYIDIGHHAFCRYAERLAGAAEHLLNQGLARARQRLKAAQAELGAAQLLSSSRDDQGERSVSGALQTVKLRQVIAGCFETQKNLLSQGPLSTALQHVRMDDHVESLNISRGGWLTQLMSAAGAGVPAGIASTPSALARTYLFSDAHALGVAAQSLIKGSLIGVVHETLDNFVRPAAREIMSSWGMREPCQVEAAEIIPDAPRATVLNGRYHERSDDEWWIAQSAVEDARACFRNAQQDYKSGTLKGDALIFMNLSAAQMIRKVMEFGTHLEIGTPGVQALASFGGQFAACSSQAYGQLNKTYRYDGRDLPTHTPTLASQESLFKRLGQRAEKSLPSIDPREREMRISYVSKIWSSSEAMLAYNAVGSAAVKVDPSTRTGAVCSVLLTGVQTLGFQMPFEANKRSGAESEANDTDRVRSALANVLDPDRISLTHGTQKGSLGRQLENLYNRARGIEQLPAQMATVVTETVVTTPVRVLGSALHGVACELRGLGLRHPKSRPADGPHDLETASHSVAEGANP